MTRTPTFMKEKKGEGVHEAHTYTVQPGEVSTAQADGVFGAVEDGGQNYTNSHWLASSVVLLKAQIGLGVLGIPQLFSLLGLVPGLLILLAVAIMTSYASYIIGRFKLRHPEVHSIADVGYLIWGPVGREVLGGIYWLYMICSGGSGLLSTSIALNAVSNHGTCTVVFVVAAAIIAFLLGSIQTLEKVSVLGYVGLISIFGAIITLTVAVGISSDRPHLAPEAPLPFDKAIVAFGNPTFAQAGNAIGQIVFSYGAIPASFNIVAEMRRPADFTKTTALAQSVITATYVILGVLVYVFCGQYIASPALGSAGPTMKKVCYGIAIPALLVSATIFAHLSAKYVFVRLFRGTRHLTSNSATHWIGWLGSVAFCVLISFIIAEAVPVFSGLTGIVGALFGSIMSFPIMGIMWFYDEWTRKPQPGSGGRLYRWHAMVVWNTFIILAGLFICVAGTYGAIIGIKNQYQEEGGASFSCADNSL